MVEFHGWQQPPHMDVLVAVGTWGSLCRFKSGRIKLHQWRVTAAVNGQEFRKTVKRSPEAATKLLTHKLTQAVESASRTIRQTTESGWLVLPKKNGRLHAKRIERIAWMNNNELGNLPVALG